MKVGVVKCYGVHYLRTVSMYNYTKMCVNCCKERMPNRGTTCLEAGAYLLNYACCHQCQSKEIIGERERKREEDEDGEELITFKHVCQQCGHEIATHKYSFSVDENFQEYMMQCNLCGHGEASVSVLPDDPREKELF